MKKLFVTLGVFSLLIFFTQCKKDNEDKKNGFTYKGTFYNAELLGIFIYYGSNYDFHIEISNGTGWDATFNRITGDVYTIIRLKAVTYIDGNLLGVGEYVYSLSSTQPGTIKGGYESFCFNFNSSTYSCEEYPDVVGGSLTVNKEDNDYILEYSLTLSNNETIEGYYKGELDYITED